MSSKRPQPGSLDGTIAQGAEVELKLAVDPRSLRQLANAPAIESRSRGRPVTQRLESIYYDTPDLRLHRQAMALRVRRIGRRFVQTLKTDGRRGGIMQRGEWEAAVRSLEPDLAALPVPRALRDVGPIRPGELRSLFASRVERQVRVVRDTDTAGRVSEIEIAFDRGVVEAEAGSVPVCEVELQLRNGTPASLYRLALELHEVSPVRVETQSKSDRGYALAQGAPPGWRKAGKLTLDPAISVDDALAAVVRHCLDHWAANEAAALDGRDPEGVHQLRVALRRLRSGLTLFRKVIPADQFAWLKTESKWLLASLGGARDWDVFRGELMAPAIADHPDHPALALAAARAERNRGRGYGRARRALGSARYTRLLLRLGMWVEGRGWRTEASPAATALLARPMVEFADRLLAKRHRRVLKLGKDFAALGAEERHRVRIALKKLRYAIEFFRTLYRRRRASAYAKTVAALQDDLGHLNDVAVAERLLGTLINQARTDENRARLHEAATLILGRHREALAAGEPKLLADWERFVEGAPFWHEGRRPAD